MEKITASFVITTALLEAIKRKAIELQRETGIDVSDSAALRVILSEYAEFKSKNEKENEEKAVL